MGYAQSNIYDLKYGRLTVKKSDECFSIVSSDGGFADITGYSSDEIAGVNICDIVPENDAAAMAQKLSELCTSEDAALFEVSLIVKSGHTKRFLLYAYGSDEGIEITITQHDYAQRSGFAFEDISAMFSVMGTERTKEEINNYLSSADSKNKEHYLMLVDIDNYGKFLNSYGRQFVGTVMKNILAAMIRIFRSADVIIGHIGEDVVAVLLKDSDEKAVMDYARRIREMVSRTYMGAQEYGVSADCKIGISKAFVDGSTFGELSSRAQMALDEAKTSHIFAGIYNENTRVSEKYKEQKFEEFSSVENNDYERGFVAFATSLITHSRNNRCSINLLMECIGRNFNIDSIVINEHIPERRRMRMTNYWDSIDGVCKVREEEFDYTEWDGFIKGFNKDGFMFIPDTSRVESENDREWFKEKGIKSCVNCMLYDGVQMLGYIAFCVNKEGREWSKTLIETLIELSKIISMAVAVRIGERNQMDLFEKDDVTGLLTYQAFIKKAQLLISQNGVGKSYAVIYADINNFAYVNDNFGLYEGNRLLYETGDRLKMLEGALVCRPGADRFVCLVPASAEYEETVEKLRSMFAQIDEMFTKRFPRSDLSMTAGICNLVSGTDDFITMLENANATRKAVKEDSTEKIGIFTPELRDKRQREMDIIGNVHQAIEDGEIIAYLQPKVMLSKRMVVGAEALVRWIKKDGTMQFPGDFIPVLEKVGYIVDVDFCVYEQALKILADWRDKGYELIPVSVNFSRQHLKHKGFEERIRDLAKKYNISPEYIEIEVTESMVASDVVAAIKSLGKLREFGFKIDIDDFGTGYSSLNTLVETPADIVKIDKCFVDKTDTDEGKNYTKRIAEVAVASNKEPVFEGVETEAQAQFLQDNGYDVVQGFLFSRPIPVEEFEEKYMK